MNCILDLVSRFIEVMLLVVCLYFNVCELHVLLLSDLVIVVFVCVDGLGL